MGAATFFCHSWSLLNFFNKLSSFILRFTIAEVAEVFAFMMAFAFLESLAVTFFLVLLSALLPASWLKHGFSLKAFMIIVIAAIASIAFQSFLTSDFPSPLLLTMTCVLPVLLIGLVLPLIRSQPGLRHFLDGVQDRLSIMLFVFAPIGLLSILLVVVSYVL